jgi:hypothetical protein
MTVLMVLSSIAVEQTKAMEINNGTFHPTAGLPRKPFRGEGEISCVGHGNEYTLRGVKPIQNKSAQQSMWALFHGLNAQKRGTHQIKWGFLCEHNNIKVCGGISGGSRTWSFLPQLPRWNNL